MHFQKLGVSLFLMEIQPIPVAINNRNGPYYSMHFTPLVDFFSREMDLYQILSQFRVIAGQMPTTTTGSKYKGQVPHSILQVCGFSNGKGNSRHQIANNFSISLT